MKRNNNWSIQWKTWHNSHVGRTSCCDLHKGFQTLTKVFLLRWWRIHLSSRRSHFDSTYDWRPRRTRIGLQCFKFVIRKNNNRSRQRDSEFKRNFSRNYNRYRNPTFHSYPIVSPLCAAISAQCVVHHYPSYHESLFRSLLFPLKCMTILSIFFRYQRRCFTKTCLLDFQKHSDTAVHLLKIKVILRQILRKYFQHQFKSIYEIVPAISR